MSTTDFYQSIPRKFRPKRFSQVVGQETTITTLKNALKENILAHAYLFAGSRGSGKTTIARILAKALCCSKPEGIEPCCTCTSCKEIEQSRSLDVIEIDGASNRGIDDTRRLTEAALYTPANGKCKIYLIDEVHMLTKEAFNALLKTLEEPPPKVKFFLATTEPHKILPTIISRCQRFDLTKIASSLITDKLATIAQILDRNVAKDALSIIASKSDGSLRDAESLLDQLLAFKGGDIDKTCAIQALGLPQESDFLAIDAAFTKEDFSFPFSFVEMLFSRGQDLSYFLEELLLHFRAHFLRVLSQENTPYTKETLLWIFDLITEEVAHFSQKPSQKLALEMLLLRILRAKKRVSLETLWQRLEEISQLPDAASAIHTPSQSPCKPDEKQKDPIAETVEPAIVPVPFSFTKKAPVESASEKTPQLEPQENLQNTSIKKPI